MLAARNNSNPEVVALLLQAGADIHEKANRWRDAAYSFAASYNSNPEVVALLLKAGADIHEKDKYGMDAAYVCCEVQL